MGTAPELGAAPCPCGRGRPLEGCCGPVLAGGRAATAEDLMRSRYTAFTLRDVDHLLRSWSVSTRPATVTFDDALVWDGLEILDTDRGRLLDTTGVVEFRARFVRPGRRGAMHERSRFVREDGLWTYLDAIPHGP